ncbi:MAG: geranylgeranyl reductase family protein [Aureispira sp.]|nr:geranylgeranyl reductase family protein [Aureispira sp.]
MNIQKFDIAICGAGPAGSTCALALAKSGLKVALIDKSTFPRDKICGDALAPYMGQVLGTIDPKLKELYSSFEQKEAVNTLRIFAPNTKALDLSFPIQGAICSRMDFDNFLFEQATKYPNIYPLLGQSVKDVEATSEHVNITLGDQTKLQAQLIIGCDGTQGIVSKKLTDNKVDLHHHSAAVRAYYSNVTDIQPGSFELHYFKGLVPGYFWIFPLPGNKANVGFGMLSETTSERKVNLREKMQELIESVPSIKDRFKDAERLTPVKGFGLPLGSRKITISGERFMLCGDAASLIDPLTGEGIGQAVISGRYAGWHAIKCFEQQDFSAEAMLPYRKMVYDKLWKANSVRYRVQRLITRFPWLINSITNLGVHSKLVRKLVAKLV